MRRIAAGWCVPMLSLLAMPVHPHAALQVERSTPGGPSPITAAAVRALLDRHCVTCHSDARRTAGLSLEKLSTERLEPNTAVWEKVARKLSAGEMPPAGMARPSQSDLTELASFLEASLDNTAKQRPNPGHLPAHRLNRTEYGNAVRDLLALEVDVTSLLPGESSASGFDNIAENLTVSPALLDRYVVAARKISRLAVGDATVRQDTYVVPQDWDQSERVNADLPIGSRGGYSVQHHFPMDGEYLIKVRLRRNRYDELRGLGKSHLVEVRVDGVRVHLFPPVGGEVVEAGKEDDPIAVHRAITDYLTNADAGLQVRLPIRAGVHAVSVSLLDWTPAHEGPAEVLVRPEAADYYHARSYGEGIGRIEIQGPESVTGPGDTPSQRRIFVCRPTTPTEESGCAKQILSTISQRAYRRPVTETELRGLLSAYEAGRRGGTFEAGVEAVIRQILASPFFLFRVESQPRGVAPGTPYRVSDIDFASRLSFFLWSSIPDDELLTLAIRGRLSDPAVLEQQVRRMVADPKSRSLISNFAGQWLQLRNLAFVTPDVDIFPDFNENLRGDFRRETELFVESILREDRDVLDLLTADYTFLNERLARYYGIPNVQGEHFRRVVLPEGHKTRAGLLGQASILTVTSYATRTSPVIRGKWLLDNILGTPPPPPPPNVPGLQEKNEDNKPLSMRAAMERHRKNPVCASCHMRMDPLGFALENFDAIGRFRTVSESQEPIDASGVMPDGAKFRDSLELRKVLASRRKQFVHTVTEKLLTYAIGRSIEPFDMPAVRAIERQLAHENYRLSGLILAVVRSMPFQMRTTADGSVQTRTAAATH
jgi:mono/diheme cytochrome c family protein